MNRYIRNLDRIEFVVTYACTGRCRHCSEGEHTNDGVHLDGALAARIVKGTASAYEIHSMMTFGGEALLYPEDVCQIHAAARDSGIKERQLITNGYFSKDPERIRGVAAALAASGVNDILLSVDAFHQETIPLDPVMLFAGAVSEQGVRIRTHPAWLSGKEAENPYNARTWELLKVFEAMGIGTNDGNIIFPSGNALRYLGAYFDNSRTYEIPYTEDPRDIRAVCIAPDGAVLGGNIYQEDICDILEAYVPEGRM